MGNASSRFCEDGIAAVKSVGQVFWETKDIFALCLATNLASFAAYALPMQSERYYDLTGSATFILATLYSLIRKHRSSHSKRTNDEPFNPSFGRWTLASACLLLWSGRLGWFLFSRIQAVGIDHRFDRIKVAPAKFLFAWVMQAVWNYFVGLPVYLLNRYRSENHLTGADHLGFALWATGFAIQVIADEQKRLFAASEGNRGEFIRHGLWSISRHPNYLGEILMGVALSFVAYQALSAPGSDCPAPAVSFISPSFTTYLLRFLSGVPMLEKSGWKKWGGDPAYRSYLERTPMILPTWRSITAPPLPVNRLQSAN